MFIVKVLLLQIIIVMIAVCPYFATFRHKPEVIEKLEKAGLGYHVKAEQTKDQLGTQGPGSNGS